MGKTVLSQKDRELILEQLVEELMKDQPLSSKVRSLSMKLGIPYSGDPLTQINTVLHSMGSVYLRAPRRRELSQ